MEVNRIAILRFFDEISQDSTGHVTAINAVVGEDMGVALLKHFLQVECDAIVNVLDIPVTQGTKKGYRLDRWVHVTYPSGNVVYYQVEIKNWSATAIGGRELPINSSPQSVSVWKKKQWNNLWDSERQSFKEVSLAKVMTPMVCPDKQAKVEPLACLWWALHPEGAESPWFEIAIDREDSHFRTLNVFSMSSYLRSLQEPSIHLEMPNATRRIDWLTSLFSLD